MKTITKIVNTICTVMGFIGGGLLALMMLYTTYDVIQRLLTKSAITGSIELMAYAFCAVLYSSYCYTQIKHGHIHVTVITEALPGRAKFILWAITSILGTVTGIVLAFATYSQAVQQIVDGSYTAMLHIPYAPVYMLSFVGTALFAVALLLDAIKAVLAIFNKDYAKEVAKGCFVKQKT